MEKNKSTVKGSNFNSSLIRLGTITTALAIITNFFPVIYLYFRTGIAPGVDSMKLFATLAAVYAAAWITMPITYFPVLGTGGSYVGWIAGSVSDIRLPAARMCQKISGYEEGTLEGDIASIMGITASVFVSITIVSIFAIIGASLVPLLPEFVTDSFVYIIPAVFSAIFIDVASKDYLLAGILFTTGILIVVFLPLLGFPRWSLMPITIILGGFIAYLKFKKDNK